MIAVKGIYNNGQVKLLEAFPIEEQRNILVIFPDDFQEEKKIKSYSEMRKELLKYFIHHRREEPLEYLVKDLIEEGKRK